MIALETDLRSKTKVVEGNARLKWDWAEHVCRMNPDLWAKVVEH